MKKFILVYDKRTGKRLSFSVIGQKPRKKRRQTFENQVLFWVFGEIALRLGPDSVTTEIVLAVFRRDPLLNVAREIDVRAFIKKEKLPIAIESPEYHCLVLRLKRGPKYTKKSKQIIFKERDLKEKISYWKNPRKKSKSRRPKFPAHNITRGKSAF